MGFSAGKIIKTKNRIHPSETISPKVSKVSKGSQVVKSKTEVVDQQEHAVIINGKQKKISKKSAFLLDMLTLDDE